LALLIPFSDNQTSNQYGAYKSHSFVPIFLDNKLRYCSYWNITCVLGTTSLDYKLKSARFLKIYWIIRLLRRGFQYILVMDMDTLFLDPTHAINLTALLPKGRYLALSPDLSLNNLSPSSWDHTERYIHKYSSQSSLPFSINTGVMLIRYHPLIYRFFSSVYRLSYSLSHTSIHVSDTRLLALRDSDQTAILFLLTRSHTHKSTMNLSSKTSNKSILSLITVLNKQQYNAYPTMPYLWSIMRRRPGDQRRDTKIVHFAGEYGGSDIETGKPDILTTLLSLVTICNTHHLFLLKCAEMEKREREKESKRETSLKRKRSNMNLSVAISGLNQTINSLQHCVKECYSMLILHDAIQRAEGCVRRAVIDIRRVMRVNYMIKNLMTHDF